MNMPSKYIYTVLENTMAKINQLPPLAPVREVVLITKKVAELIGVGGTPSPSPSGPNGEGQGV